MKVGDTFDYCGMAAIVTMVWSEYAIDIIAWDRYAKRWEEFNSVPPPPKPPEPAEPTS